MKRYRVRIRAAGYAMVRAESKAAARRDIERQEKAETLLPYHRITWAPEVSSIEEVKG